MHRAPHYRELADHARQLAQATWQDDLEEMLGCLARDFDEIADDIEAYHPKGLQVRFGRPGCALNRPTWSPVKGSSARVSPIGSEHTLLEESVIVALVCMIFLLHARSALVAIIMLLIGVLIAFIVMHAIGISSNIMSLGGIAIAIGAMVDAAIVMIENAHKRLERAPPGASRIDVLVNAATEVGPALFFSLLVITVSFAPVFTLEAQEGRLFKPLVYTYTFSLAAAALLSVTMVPVLMTLFVRGRILPEQKNPLNRALIWLYRPIIDVVLRWPKITIGLAAIVLRVSIYPVNHIGSEFMPTLDEGTLFYMPVSLPSMSITKAAELLQTQDKIIKSFPEVESVFGKAGRANTATDPAPTEMFETVINLKPESEWRPGMTVDQLVSDMNKALDFPG